MGGFISRLYSLEVFLVFCLGYLLLVLHNVLMFGMVHGMSSKYKVQSLLYFSSDQDLCWLTYHLIYSYLCICIVYPNSISLDYYLQLQIMSGFSSDHGCC